MDDKETIRFEVTWTAGAAATEDTLQLPHKGLGSAGGWELVSYTLVRTGGGGATYQPRVGESAGWTDGDIDERLTCAVTPVGTKTHEVFAQPIPCYPDANNRLYHRAGWDAGVNNAAKAILEFRPFRGEYKAV